jgi:hypothetical protein
MSANIMVDRQELRRVETAYLNLDELDIDSEGEEDSDTCEKVIVVIQSHFSSNSLQEE